MPRRVQEGAGDPAQGLRVPVLRELRPGHADLLPAGLLGAVHPAAEGGSDQGSGPPLGLRGQADRLEQSDCHRLRQHRHRPEDQPFDGQATNQERDQEVHRQNHQEGQRVERGRESRGKRGVKKVKLRIIRLIFVYLQHFN